MTFRLLFDQYLGNMNYSSWQITLTITCGNSNLCLPRIRIISPISWKWTLLYQIWSNINIFFCNPLKIISLWFYVISNTSFPMPLPFFSALALTIHTYTPIFKFNYFSREGKDMRPWSIQRFWISGTRWLILQSKYLFPCFHPL